MADSEPFTIGAEAVCTDGTCGHVTQVVVDPLDRSVTHLIVEPDHRAGLGRLVPLDLVDARPGQVQLRCTREEFEKLDRAEDIRFLPGTEAQAGYDPEQTLVWPYFGGNTTVPVTVDTLPLGEVAVRRGEQVHATDGHIGQVRGLVVERATRHVSHLLLEEGHLWGRKEVAIPIGKVKTVNDDGILLTLSKGEIEDLPPTSLE